MKCFQLRAGLLALVLLYDFNSGLNAIGENHIWIRWVGGAGSSGSGTLDVPFVVGTAIAFDALLESQNTNTTIELLPGNFETKGRLVNSPSGLKGWEMKSGQTLRGSGIGRTILKLVELTSTSNSTHEKQWAVKSKPNAVGCLVEDLTVDCNFLGLTPPAGYFTTGFNLGAVMLTGESHTIRRVAAVHAGSSLTGNAEAFVIGVFADSAPSLVSANNLIQNCLVDGNDGNQGLTAIAMNQGTHPRPISGIVEGNRVQLPLWDGVSLHYMNCFGVSGVSNVIIRGNSSSGGGKGIYNDTGSIYNLLITENAIENVRAGVHFNWMSSLAIVVNLSVINNKFTLHTGYGDGGPVRIGIWNEKYTAADTQEAQNFLISGNTVRYSDEYVVNGGALPHYPLAITGVRGLHIFNNFFQDSAPFYPSIIVTSGTNSNSIIHSTNNFSLSGTLITLPN